MCKKLKEIVIGMILFVVGISVLCIPILNVYASTNEEEGSKVTENATIGHYYIGLVAGTQGYGCYALGHISPTRESGMLGPTTKVIDVAATYGTWRIRWRYMENL